MSATNERGAGPSTETAPVTDATSLSEPVYMPLLRAIAEPDDLIEVRTIHPTRLPRNTAARSLGAKTIAQWAKGNEKLRALNEEGEGIYLSPHPRKTRGGRDTDAVACWRVLAVDIDEPSLTRADLVRMIADAGLPVPTAIVFTGGGWHLYWRLDAPIFDLDDMQARVRGIVKRISGDRSATGGPQLLRLPGFANTKPDRGGAAVRISDIDERRVYAADEFPPLVMPKHETPTAASATSGTIGRATEWWLSGRQRAPGRSTALFTAACDLAARGWSEADALALLRTGAEKTRYFDDYDDAKFQEQVHNAFAKPREPSPDRDSTRASAPSVAEWEPFPAEALPEPVRSFASRGAEAIGCDPSFVALPLLSALSAAIGATTRIELKRGWSEPPTLWTAIIGESGQLKTPPFKLAMGPLRRAQEKAWKEHAAAHEQWKTDCLTHEVTMTEWRKRAAKVSDDPPAPPEAPTEPVATRYIVSDTTVEALAPILLGNPRGLLLARDELAGWIGSFDRYAGGRGGSDSAHYLSMHSGDATTVDRRTGNPRTIHLPYPLLAIAGGIQPGILRRVVRAEHRESGLLARLCVSMPPRRVKRWTEATIDDATNTAMETIFGALLSLTFAVDDRGDDRPRLLTLAPDGKAEWIAYYDDHAREEADLSGDEAAAWSKLEGGAARLALIIHLVRVAAGDRLLRDPAMVDAASVAAAVRLARWFGREALRVYDLFAEGDSDRTAREFLEWIARRGGSVTVRDLAHGMRRFRGITAEAEAALEALVARRKLVRVSVDHHGSRGRPTTRYELVTASPVTGNGAAPGEDTISGDGDSGDAPASGTPDPSADDEEGGAV